ncbi:alpha/beta hydrolase, PF06821 family protein [Caballeronia mineralivorans PML1(12)]|uniref:Alpha/beta hydrolase, PF06821 family protein n=1 Tax=Caballeronia mineralivorans PML1(12) TaxID=908627 RepID=A0A0J1FRJ0_9BURK|nr:alpha/beta hydrolase [Caballeronia mineralivorans]KLU22383.1 alpha/beta hydrolase, PF06821 family protein [Caballeronia mineralivorans PML1(12)]
MDHPVFVVPGIGNSAPLHWQSRWEAAHPEWRRLVVKDWDQVACNDWISAIERQVAKSGDDTVIVAHSLGCLAVVHWAARHLPRIRGALLVAVPDPATPAFPAAAATGFAPLPSERLPFPTIVVSSSNDPYGGADHARRYAKAWGSKLIEVGEKGHLNADSDLGDWPEGFRLLQSMNE